jgi:hypothetical protein
VAGYFLLLQPLTSDKSIVSDLRRLGLRPIFKEVKKVNCSEEACPSATVNHKQVDPTSLKCRSYEVNLGVSDERNTGVLSNTCIQFICRPVHYKEFPTDLQFAYLQVAKMKFELRVLKHLGHLLNVAVLQDYCKGK